VIPCGCWRCRSRPPDIVVIMKGVGGEHDQHTRIPRWHPRVVGLRGVWGSRIWFARIGLLSLWPVTAKSLQVESWITYNWRERISKSGFATELNL
jgi:hypothetical protein